MERGAAAILLAAGAGTRLAAAAPKGFVELAGRPMARWSALALAAVPEIRRIVLVVPEDLRQVDSRAVVDGLRVGTTIVTGGRRRRDSVASGLAACAPFPLVLVHDAARPLVRPPLVRRVLEAAAEAGAAVPAIPLPDTIVRERRGRIAEMVDRDRLKAVQTPQGFHRELLVEAHTAAPTDWDAPDDGTMIRRLGAPVVLVEGDRENFKVTWGHDLDRAERIAMQRAESGPASGSSRIGLGWDVHPLESGRRFVVVGVEVADAYGPVGHSDGDPLAHAVADALLGAAALGDIGTLFPDDDPGCAGIAGLELLARTVSHLSAAGWRPAQVDAVLITDRPKLAPFRDAIVARLAGALGLSGADVSVKGKRTEGLGALAGGAGVCCHCVATISRVVPNDLPRVSD